MRDPLEAGEKLCAELGQHPADVALAWLLANPVVTAPIIGPRTLAQLDGSLRALDLVLDDDVMGRLDEIFPGPGRTRARGLRLVNAELADNNDRTGFRSGRYCPQVRWCC